MIGRTNLVVLSAILFGQAASLHAFVANDRWNNTATNGGTGTTGTPITLTWGLVDDGTEVPDGGLFTGSDLIDMLDFEFGAGPGGSDYTLRPWFSIFTDSFDRLGQLSGLDYVYEPNDDGVLFTGGNSGVLGVRGDLRIGGRDYGSSSTTLAANFFPDYGEMIVNTDRGSFFDNTPNNFRAMRNTLMHESLHGVGISHVDPASPNLLMEPSISTAFDGPQLDDILAMQRLYGDVLEKNGGNNTFATATPLGLVGELQAAVRGQSGSNVVIAATETDFVSIDDNSDIDYFSFTLAEDLNVSIDLMPQGASYLTGPEGGSVNTLDTRGLSDLALTLLDSNGTSVLATSNAGGLGENESLAMALTAGTYYTRVTGGQNNIQLYQLSVAEADTPENLVWQGQQNNTWDFQGTANFDDGGGPDLFANLDTVTFDNTGLEQIVNLVGGLNPAAIVINATVDYTFSGSGAITGGSLTINGAGTVEFANSGNSYSGPTQVNSGTLIFSGDTRAMISAVTVADGATLVMDSNVAGENSSTFLIEPGGTLQVGRATSAADVFPNNPVSLVNNGTIRILDFESVTNITGSGSVIAVAELGLLENNSYTGQTIVQSGASIQPTDNSAFGSAVGNTIVEVGGYVLASNDDFGPASLSLPENFLLAGSGDGAGAMQIAASTTAVFAGAWTIDAGGASMSVRSGSSVSLTGTFDALAGQATLDISADSTFMATGNAMIGVGGFVKTSAGPATFSGTFDVDGPVDVQSGSLGLVGSGAVAGAVRVASGASLQIAMSTTWQATSSLTGLGTINGNLTMPGTLAPGDSAPGSLAIDGELTLTGESLLAIELGGVVPNQFDRLDVSGGGQLDGTLSVNLIDLGGGVYEPQQGDSFGFLVTQAGITGSFDDLLLPGLEPGLDWQLDTTGLTALLNVINVSSVLADLDGDGFVGSVDLGILLGNWESHVLPSEGELNNLPPVDGLDLGILLGSWNPRPLLLASHAVPEPGAGLLLLIGWAALPRSRRALGPDQAKAKP